MKFRSLFACCLVGCTPMMNVVDGSATDGDQDSTVIREMDAATDVPTIDTSTRDAQDLADMGIDAERMDAVFFDNAVQDSPFEDSALEDSALEDRDIDAIFSSDASDAGLDGDGAIEEPYVPGPPVSTYVNGTRGCSTTVVFGLAQQMVDTLSCGNAIAFRELPVHPRIQRGEAFFPTIQTAVVNALIGVADASPNTMRLTSGLRSLPQQYLLYQWGQRRVCGIGVVAPPNRSNHLSGSAVDVSNWQTMRSELEDAQFVWYGMSDAVHFDLPVGTVDTRVDSVRVFQQLWNLNHPEDLIDEDGIYGPQTVSRLLRSPANGFEFVPPCPR